MLATHKDVVSVGSGGPSGRTPIVHSAGVSRYVHKLGATAGGAPFPQSPARRSPNSHSKRDKARLTAKRGIAEVAGGGGVPAIALAAYERAAEALARRDPACGLDWEDLAGIGKVESDNGLTWGSLAKVTNSGTLTPPIIGPALDGQNGFPAIPTPDGGVLENDPVWEHAVGPMQFLPSTWLSYSNQALGIEADPQNFFAAAQVAGFYLCADGGNLGTATGLQHAIYSYNHSASYVLLVESWIAYYRHAGTQAILSSGAGLLPLGQGLMLDQAGGSLRRSTSLGSSAAGSPSRATPSGGSRAGSRKSASNSTTTSAPNSTTTSTPGTTSTTAPRVPVTTSTNPTTTTSVVPHVTTTVVPVTLPPVTMTTTTLLGMLGALNRS